MKTTYFNALGCQFVFWLLMFSMYISNVEADGNEEEGRPVKVILFMFFGIGVGIIFMQVLNKFKEPIPYTVAIFLAGILFSLANREGTGRNALNIIFI